MEYILAGIVILQFAYIFYKEKSSRDERENLRTMIKSKDVFEYKEAISPPAKDAESEPSPYRNLDEVSSEKLLRAEDNL